MIDINIDNIHEYDFIFADAITVDKEDLESAIIDLNTVDKEDLEDAILQLKRNDFPYEGRQLWVTITRLENLINEAIQDGDLKAVRK